MPEAVKCLIMPMRTCVQEWNQIYGWLFCFLSIIHLNYSVLKDWIRIFIVCLSLAESFAIVNWTFCYILPTENLKFKVKRCTWRLQKRTQVEKLPKLEKCVKSLLSEIAKLWESRRNWKFCDFETCHTEKKKWTQNINTKTIFYKPIIYANVKKV